MGFISARPPILSWQFQAFQGCIHFIILHIVLLLLSLAVSNDLCSEPHGLESDLTESKLLFFPGGKNI